MPSTISKTSRDGSSFIQKTEISDYLRSRNVYQSDFKKYYPNQKMNDLLALLVLMDKYLTDEVKRRSIIEIGGVIKRCTKYTHLIKYTEDLERVYDIFKNIVDSYDLEC